MKKILYIFLFSLIFLSNKAIANDEWEIIETPFITIESVPIDEEHIHIFDNVMIDFLDKAWESEKTFPDGDSFVQILKGIKLVRIDALPNNIDRYVTYLTFNVKRYYAENVQYTEEFSLQLVYLDVDKNTKKLVYWTAFETIDLNNFLKKEI